ncbi:trypsin-like serine protease [Streptomyces sp. NPDC059070]|uniref:trypsin-like serine protease n=1 Tax=Streptomyces sp. NPDC059070 TaxID=3346713 RepID=UPI0036BC7ECA
MSLLYSRLTRTAGLVVTATAVTAGLVTAGTAQAVTGPEAAAGQHASAVKLSIGDVESGRSCTATLVDPSWIMTAASCFAATPGSSVPSGRPALATTATLSDGKSVEVTDVVARDDRDVALARLATPVTSVSAASRAATAPAAGTDLTAAGFGRTATEWVPGKLHTGSFTVTTANPTSLAITGKGTDAICKGDTGGPLFNAAGELVGVNSRSWMGGCLGTNPSETRTGAVAARTDGLNDWIASAKQRPAVLRSGATLASGATLTSEYGKLVMQADGNLVIYHGTGGEGRGGALWASGTGGNPGAFAKMQADGNLVVYKKGGGDTVANSALWASGTWGHAGATLSLGADANLVVFEVVSNGNAGTGKLLWQTGTGPRGDKLAADAKLMPGQWLTNGKTVLLMDIQGNVLIRELATGRELWSKVTWDWYSYLHMQNDGNLVLYKKDGGQGKDGALWSTQTWNGAGSYATLETNGSLVVRWNSGGERWASSSFRGQQSGRCLDSYNGNDAVIWDCWGGANQQWVTTAAKELRSGGKCLTAEPGANQGSHLKVIDCDGRAEQKWNVNTDNATITSALKPNQCVNVFSEATANASIVGLWQCGNGTNAQWTRP